MLISPKKSPGPRLETGSPPRVISISPSSSRKKVWFSRPSLIRTSPDGTDTWSVRLSMYSSSFREQWANRLSACSAASRLLAASFWSGSFIGPCSGGSLPGYAPCRVGGGHPGEADGREQRLHGDPGCERGHPDRPGSAVVRQDCNVARGHEAHQRGAA